MTINQLHKTLRNVGWAIACSLLAQQSLAQISDGRYNIVSRHSGLAMEVDSASQDDGANIIQWTLLNDGSQGHQQFDVTNVGNGQYSIRPVHSGKSLDVWEFSTEPGGEIRQWDYWGGDNQHWQIESVGDGHYKIVSAFNGLALDVWEWSSSNGGDIRQWTDLNGWNQHWSFQTPGDGSPGGGDGSACLNSPIGFAALGGGTTGGAGGTVITVSTGNQLSAAIDAHEDAWKQNNSRRTIIRVNGTINASNSSVSRFDIKDMDNLSIIGVGNNGVLDGRGIMMRGANNIIIRNLTIRYVRDGSGDGIEIDGSRPVRNVWIDHNTFYNTLNADKDYYDGLIDGKNDIDNISITYNVMRDSWKTSLWGQNDSNNYNRRVTFAYNRIENVNSRVPLLRFGQTHIYNNYYNNIIDTGINTRMGNRVRIEGNVFENSKNPIVSCYSSDIGYWHTNDNSFSNINWQTSGDCVIAGPNVGSTVNYNPPYSYNRMSTNQVKNHVLANAGAGQCNL